MERSRWREVTNTILRGQLEGGGQGGDLHQGRLSIVTQGEGGNVKTPVLFLLSEVHLEEDQDDILLLFCLWSQPAGSCEAVR